MNKGFYVFLNKKYFNLLLKLKLLFMKRITLMNRLVIRGKKMSFAIFARDRKNADLISMIT